ncbi:MAG TPA: DUF1440 domain-containing protein [Bryobacteraceae bacterium]|jgi:uncharacterized membrane protein YagU involved in acid resistance|nr:DUF1440 domain-containing protein [Bryobacteraceae bacterium]
MRNSKHGSLSRNLLLGAVGGLAASWVMTQFQSAMSAIAKPANQKSQPSGDDATVKTADAISHQVAHQPLRPKDKGWAGPLVHYAFGTLVGALYGGLAKALPATRAGHGTAYGTAVWLAADEVAVPALGLSGSPGKNPPSTHVKALASHLVYGLTTDLTMRALNRVAARAR